MADKEETALDVALGLMTVIGLSERHAEQVAFCFEQLWRSGIAEGFQLAANVADAEGAKRVAFLLLCEKIRIHQEEVARCKAAMCPTDAN